MRGRARVGTGAFARPGKRSEASGSASDAAISVGAEQAFKACVKCSNELRALAPEVGRLPHHSGC
jgi:hypothetical protein